MESLRDQRKRIDKKISDSKKSGAGTDEIFKPSVWWYEMVSFLCKDSALKSGKTTDNLNVSQITVID